MSLSLVRSMAQAQCAAESRSVSRNIFAVHAHDSRVVVLVAQLFFDHHAADHLLGRPLAVGALKT
jgi:hypothetical protein